jgi:hypothetical protein
VDKDTDEMPVLMELAREHAWRLLLDWPQETGNPPDMAGLLALRRASPERFTEVLERVLRHHLLGEKPEAWLGRDLDGLDAWRQAGGTLPARLFGLLGDGPDPGFSSAQLLPVLADWDADMAQTLARRALADPTFCAMPDWRGAPAEMGAIVRMRNHPMLAAWIGRRGQGLGARLLARLLELAALPERSRLGGTSMARAWRVTEPLDVHLVHHSGESRNPERTTAWTPAFAGVTSLSSPPAEGVGIAGVETSRGLLFHMASLRDGRVADYRILAPTEWNFHPAGPLVQALAGLPAGQGLAALARLVGRSLDPCVAFGLEIVDA